MVLERNDRITHHPDMAAIEDTMAQVPLYFQKVMTIKTKMAEISGFMDRMKKQAEYLQIQAQSHAIAKEDRQNKSSQWNKLVPATPNGHDSNR
jgi:hypothetical protein